ncbi:MAG: phage holin family protein [Flavobacterium sp.]|nr:phage holin family protein [Flavobacterium sp.]
MAFEELKEHTEDIQKQAQAYIENSLAYYKLWGFKVAMKSTTMMLKFALIALALMMVLLFCSVAGAFAIGKVLDSSALGFLIVGGIYLVITGLLFLIKDKMVEGSILQKFSEIFFNE